jgi:23S rRNA (uracil1939-C5)-methyltransferase
VLVPESGASEDVGRPTIRGPAPLRPEVSLLFRPEAFAQAHGQGTPLLVERTLELLAPAPEDAALELYAGNGTFTVALAARAASVLAVESSPLSVRLAVTASTQARLDNVRFVQGEAEKVCRGLVKEGRRFDVLLADPPRTGSPGLGTLARDLGVRRLLYVACDPGALARDAAGLIGTGFRLTTLQLVDMFPGTHHSETLAAFESGPE